MVLDISRQHQDQLFIGGTWRDPISTDRVSVLNPATGEEIATFIEANSDDADLAVAEARESFDNGPWAQATLAERGAVLDRAVEILEKRSEQLVELLVTDLGNARAVADRINGVAISVWRYYADLARTISLETVEETPTGPVMLRREPVGVVLAVVPWNGPVILASLKLVPALLAGCSVVVKPAPETPLSAFVLADVLAEAGLPEGVLSVLPGGRGLGAHLVAHPDVDMVSFTGGSVAGKAVMASASQHLARTTLELGGKSAAIILDDIEPADVLPVLAGGMLSQSGQVCTSITRVLVSRTRHDEWVSAIKDLFEAQVVGDPSNRDTTFGPLCSLPQQQRVLGHIEAAIEDGATIVTGGTVPADAGTGFFVLPTLVADVTPDMRLAREEVFGPVFAVMTYEDVEDAVRIANDSDYGLSGAVMTSDISLGVEIGKRIRTGTFNVNNFGASLMFPFGGYKQSGIGREGGVEGLYTFTELKQIRIPAGATF
jgi:aldehyde dehydrogenase (NAD+)